MNWMLMPLRKYAQFSGRSQRKEFWLFGLFLVLCYVLVAIVGGMFSARGLAAVGGQPTPATIVTAMGPLFIVIGLFVLAMFVPTLAVSVRRLHDIDRTGWWAGASFLLALVRSVLNMIILSNGGAGRTGSTGLAILSMVLGLAGLVLGIVLLVFYCLDGTKGPNRFGPDPKSSMPDLADRFS
jgi:uncharacterized membrane protein YhaH (DUF805 family)